MRGPGPFIVEDPGHLAVAANCTAALCTRSPQINSRPSTRNAICPGEWPGALIAVTPGIGPSPCSSGTSRGLRRDQPRLGAKGAMSSSVATKIRAALGKARPPSVVLPDRLEWSTWVWVRAIGVTSVAPDPRLGQGLRPDGPDRVPGLPPPRCRSDRLPARPPHQKGPHRQAQLAVPHIRTQPDPPHPAEHPIRPPQMRHAASRSRRPTAWTTVSAPSSTRQEPPARPHHPHQHQLPRRPPLLTRAMARSAPSGRATSCPSSSSRTKARPYRSTPLIRDLQPVRLLDQASATPSLHVPPR
jgi:hypothetical protein